MPDHVSSIRAFAFDGCKLDTITIPSLLEAIDDMVFGWNIGMNFKTHDSKASTLGLSFAKK